MTRFVKITRQQRSNVAILHTEHASLRKVVSSVMPTAPRAHRGPSFGCVRSMKCLKPALSSGFGSDSPCLLPLSAKWKFCASANHCDHRAGQSAKHSQHEIRAGQCPLNSRANPTRRQRRPIQSPPRPHRAPARGAILSKPCEGATWRRSCAGESTRSSRPPAPSAAPCRARWHALALGGGGGGDWIGRRQKRWQSSRRRPGHAEGRHRTCQLTTLRSCLFVPLLLDAAGHLQMATSAASATLCSARPGGAGSCSCAARPLLRCTAVALDARPGRGRHAGHGSASFNGAKPTTSQPTQQLARASQGDALGRDFPE